MSERCFQIITSEHAIMDGGWNLDSESTTVYNGYLAAETASGGAMGKSRGSPYGVFYDFQHNVEYPTTTDLAANLAGKKVNIATGTFLALIGKDLFESGAIPSVGTKLYDVGTGKYGAGSGATLVGLVLAQDTLQAAGGAVTVARCKLDFSGIA